MNYREAILRAVRDLIPVVGDTAKIDAEVLLMHVLGIERASLYAHYTDFLTPSKEQLFFAYLDRRLRFEPVAYIVGVREFFGLAFHVDKRVLIPRPETETLVERALGLASSQPKQALIADVGIGSGAIAVSLAVNLPDTLVYGIDRSQDALDVAAKNALLHRVSQRIRLLKGNLLCPLPEPVNMITANLPYVRNPDIAGLQHDIVDYEPVGALDGGPDGLAPIRALLGQIDGKMEKNGVVLLEIGFDQAKEVLALTEQYLPGSRTEIVKDLAGLDRVVVISPFPQV